jgi:hypothetical protein
VPIPPCRAACVALIVLALACAEPTGESSDPDLARVITPKCLPGCTDVDPNPDAPGIFLSSAVTGNACMNTSNDIDRDGLLDRCERDLAVAFAPELFYYSADEVGREPKWVAKWQVTNNTVRIGYLLSYYRDAGSLQIGCGTLCSGHHGDSEAIFLDVTYNTTSRHWVLQTAHYSVHTTTRVYDGLNGNKVSKIKLEYPEHPQTYPRAWVAIGKHANYATRAECEAGNFGAEVCDRNNAGARVAAGGQLNIGSFASHTAAQDSTLSVNPSYPFFGQGRYETYWTRKDFAGWVPNSVPGARSSPYRDKLIQFGF